MPFDLGYPSSHYPSPRPSYRGTSLQDVFSLFPDEETCLTHIFTARFGDPPQCPRCGRNSHWHRQSETRQFRCGCGHFVSPTSGTLFDNTLLPLRLWFYAMLHLANSTESTPVLFLQRHLGISHKAAWRMLDRIRFHMAALDYSKRLGRPGERLFVRLDELGAIRKAAPYARKSTRLLLLADDICVQSTVLVRPRRSPLRRIISDKSSESVRLMTTCYITYRALSDSGTRKPLAEYVPHYFTEHPALVDPIQSFLSHLRRSLHNIHRRVDHHHLWKYLKEYEFRYNRRYRSHEIFGDLVSEFPSLSPANCRAIEAWSSRLPLSEKVA